MKGIYSNYMHLKKCTHMIKHNRDAVYPAGNCDLLCLVSRSITSAMTTKIKTLSSLDQGVDFSATNNSGGS